MALSIMFYHLTIWMIVPLDSSSPLGRLGVYGVSIFFVLSGLSMAIVYNRYINSFRNSVNFYVRRIFRIWPLLWVVCILVILPVYNKTGTYDWQLFFLNTTTLFGFIKPEAYIAAGAWSIGNEMVYYALTPLIFFLYNYSKRAGNIFFLISLAIGLYFAFVLLNPHKNIMPQWTLYVHPLNNLFLYVMGIAIYYNFRNIQLNQAFNVTLLVVAIVLFCLLPYSGNQISIVSGSGRLVFSALSFLVVFSFYKLNIELPAFISKPLETFGIATYGVYLIHPVVHYFIKDFFFKSGISNNYLLYLLVVIFTVLLSVISYKYFELKMIILGKKVTSQDFHQPTLLKLKLIRELRSQHKSPGKQRIP